MHRQLYTFFIFFGTLIQFVKAETNENKFHQDLFDTSNIEVAPSIAAVLAIVIGSIICFFGYRLLRPTLFVMGFLVGAIFFYTVVRELTENESWTGYASWGAFVVGGLITGSLVLCLYNLSIFFIGAGAGVLLAFFLHTTFLHEISPEHSNVVLIVSIVILAIVCGALATCLEKPAVILATSFFGSDAAIWGIGYFAGGYPSAADLNKITSDGITSISIPNTWWYYFAATIVMFLFGVFIQFAYTSKEGGLSSSHATSSKATSRQSQDHYHNPPQGGVNLV